MKLNRQQKKNLLIDTVKELAEMMSQTSSEFVQNQLRPILVGFLTEKLDVKKVLIQINILLKESKSISNKVFWIRVTEVIKKYFDSIQ